MNKAKTKSVIRRDHIGDVVAKYIEHGWTAIRAPAEGLNDIIAHKDKRFHFVQVVTPATIDNPMYHGVAKNTFIQNAFSNQATPVYAHVLEKTRRDGSTDVTITFENVNDNARVIIGGRAKPQPAAAEQI
jgi:hypothetical protein